MDKHSPSSNAQACGAQVASTLANKVVSHGSVEPQRAQYQQNKLALDVHAASIVAVRMVDGAKSQPPRNFKSADFLAWARKQQALAKEVISCYEAGPTGFWLHRQLTALGIRNYAACPTLPGREPYLHRQCPPTQTCPWPCRTQWPPTHTAPCQGRGAQRLPTQTQTVPFKFQYPGVQA